MAIKATIQSSGNTSAKITSTTSNRPERVAVTVPATSALLNNSDFSLKALADVDVSNLANGGVLQCRSSDGKFVLRNELEETVSGALTLNAGNF